MTFAELVIKFSTTGDSQTKSQIKAIEVELKNVSNASVIAANRVSQSFQKIGQASNSLQALQGFGSTLFSNFTTAATGGNQFSKNILDASQTLLLLGSSIKNLKFSPLDTNIFKIRESFGGLNRFVRLSIGFFVDLHRQLFESALGMAVVTRGITFLSLAFQKIASGAALLQKIPMALQKGLFDLQNTVNYFAPLISELFKKLNTLGQMLLPLGLAFVSFSGYVLGAVAAMTAFSAAVVAMDIKIATETIKASFAFETLQQRLSALTTPEKATEILDFVRRLAEPSNFTTEQLANSAVQLEAFGLQSRRILPIIAQLGMAFGADSEKLKVLTDMFGRLSQGQMPDVQVMAGFGISKSKLMKEGIKFDAQGSLLSSTREVFAALEKIVERDYGKIFDKMKNTGDAKLASLVDVFERLKIKIGDALAPLAKTVIDALSKVLSALEGTKILEEMSRILTLPFRAMEKAITGGFSTNIEGALVNFVSGIIAGFEEVNIQAALFIEQMARVGRIINLVVTGKGEERNYLGILGPTKELQKEFTDFAKNFAGFFAAGRPDKLFGSGFAGEGSRFTKRQQEIADRMKVQLGEPGSNFGDLLKESKLFDYGKLENPLKKETAKQTRQLELIQQNTKTQNELTLRNMTYGGGELAAQGISAVQMGGFRSVSSPQINASNDIVRGVEKIVRGYSNSNNLNFSFRRS
jgi:hypothetical protein